VRPDDPETPTMPTNLSKNELATILSALDGQPRNPANRDKALAALERRAAALGLTTDEILDAAPGLLDGRLSPEDWLAEITADARIKVETVTAEVVAAVKAGAAERSADPESQPLPKLTRGERQLLVNIARNLMTPVNGAEPKTLDEAGAVWRDCLDQGPETIEAKSLPWLVASLTKKGLATANGESVGLTAAGLAAYHSLAAEAEARPAETTAAEAKPQIREGTKQATLIAMLRRPEGADLDEIAEATSWQKHTIRGAISGALKKKLGLEVTSTKDGQGRRIYRLCGAPHNL
jgi:hypothetical protein